MDHIRQIRVELIDEPPQNSTDPETGKALPVRTINKETVVGLAASIKDEGQLHPVGLRPSPADPARFLLVFGRHRLAAIKLLERETIEARVFPSMTDREAELATDAENLHRSPLSSAQRLLALKRFAETHDTLHPETIGRGRAGSAARARKAAARKSAAKNDPDPNATANQPADRPTAAQNPSGTFGAAPANHEPLTEESAGLAAPVSFPRRLAETTGVSLATATVTAKVVRTFSETQIHALADTNVTMTAMHRLARIGDDVQRDEAVRLVTSEGVRVPEAIATATGQPLVEDPADVTEDCRDDATWLEEECGDKRAMLANTTIFDREALAWRRIQAERLALRGVARVPVLKAKLNGGLGPFTSLLAALIFIAHPKDWPTCSHCGGAGELAERCTRCRGACAEPSVNFGRPSVAAEIIGLS